ncbi:hypothetical protein TRAPUB_10646 [Trametes pubescens]|uniref:Protein HRI1 n=1 Tax=Trametes pubescens TaxID=154538 RepID=A0A1M2VYX0_TRAPU|nr:hypothetical protein TRAPUB_10646 [Trametes pubescens]
MSISERLYIRWFPDEASEPTSTLVLTTPNRHFVDLRFYKSGPSPDDSTPSAERCFTALEWGIGGLSVGTPERGKWLHEISSRTEHPEKETDEGDMFPHPTMPDVALERGHMTHPDSGEMREYEEAWKSLPVLSVGGPHPEKRVAVFLQMREDPVAGTTRRGAVVRIGQHCQGIVRDGKDVCVQRWSWVDDGWKKVGQVGEFDIPCDSTWTNVREGDTVERGQVVWDVKEVALF